MQKNFLVAFGIGLAIIALAVGGIFLMQRGDRIELPGKILKVRTAPLDEDSSIAVIDFRITNPSDILFEVRTVTVEMEDNQGKSYLGQSVSEMDAKRLFEALPVLGHEIQPDPAHARTAWVAWVGGPHDRGAIPGARGHARWPQAVRRADRGSRWQVVRVCGALAPFWRWQYVFRHSGSQLPAGTEIQIRLKTKVATPTSKAKDPVEAVVIAPVMVDGQFVIPAGAVVRGAVEKAAQSTKPDERSTLVLAFSEIEIDGAKLKLAARVASVENARESVDEQGQITGILASETISGRLDAGLNKLAERAAGFADILGTVKKAVLKEPESDITYDAGVELALALTAPLELKAASGPGPAAKLTPIADETRSGRSGDAPAFSDHGAETFQAERRH